MIKEVNLIDVCDVIAGQSPPSSTYNQDGNGMPFFQGKADFGRIYPTVRYWCNKPKKISKPNDILFSVRAPVGPTNINNIDACIGRGLAAIRCKNIELTFLLHFLRGNEEKIASMGTGSTFKAITIGTLKELKIPLPPLDQQKKIAAILDAADSYKQKTKDLIAKYDQLTQSLFLDMFGDPVRNPRGWEKDTFDKCLLKVDKIDKSYSAKEIEYVDIASIDNARNIITGTTIYQTKERPSRAQQILRAGDVLFSTVRPNLKNIAINAIDERIGTTGFFVSRTNSKKLNNYFLYKVLLTDSVTDYFVSITSGANYPAVNSSEMKKFQIILPPLDLQNQFAERVQAIEAQKALAQQELDKANQLFNSLLQKAFKGELIK